MPNVNEALALALGLPLERLHSFTLEVRADHAPKLTATYLVMDPAEAEGLERVVAVFQLEPRPLREATPPVYYGGGGGGGEGGGWR